MQTIHLPELLLETYKQIDNKLTTHQRAVLLGLLTSNLTDIDLATMLWEAAVVLDNTEVILLYRIKDPQLKDSITESAIEKLTSEDTPEYLHRSYRAAILMRIVIGGQ